MSHTPPLSEPRLFSLYRNADESGVSGTGRVLDGVIFHNGKVVVCWRSDLRGGHSSVTVYDAWEGFLAVHVTPHPPEQTDLRFLAPGEQPEDAQDPDSAGK